MHENPRRDGGSSGEARTPDDTSGGDPGSSGNEGAPKNPEKLPRSRSGLLKILSAGGVLGAGALVLVLLVSSRSGIEPRDIAERTWIVSTVEARLTDVQPVLRLFGSIVAGREVELRPLVGGRVVAVGASFAEGGIVREGDLLARIDPFEYEADVRDGEAQLAEAQARLRELEAEIETQRELLPTDREQLDLRERELERRSRLRSRGSGSQKAVDDARLAVNEQRQRVAERQSSITTLRTRHEQQEAVVRRRQVALERARRNLRDTELRAPFSGFLSETNVSVGKLLGTNDRVARLTDAEWLEVVFQVSNEQYARLVGAGDLRGREVGVVWETAAPRFSFQADIERVAARISNRSGGVNLHARLRDTTASTPIRPGAFVEIHLRDRAYENVFRLPDSAIEGRSRVYVVQDGRLQAREIEIVGRDGNELLVRGSLEEGDRIVETIFPEIGPRLRVEVR